MSWTFQKAKFKVGDRVHFPYGRKVGTITHVGVQVMKDKDGCDVYLGLLYKITSYTLGEEQLRRYREPMSAAARLRKYNRERLVDEPTTGEPV